MSEAYERESIFFAYSKWHYGRGLSELLAIIGNFLWFVAHFFSFKLLLRTLFAPWKRMTESYGQGIDLGVYASAFIVNSLMRAVGFVIKSVVLFMGLISYIAVALFSFFIIIIWTLAPLVLIGSLILSATFFAI